jgi:hypothetical protein
MAYTAEKPPLTRSPSELRKTIPGWGVDLDPKDRPAVPKEQFDPAATGAHWQFPERQVERYPRERSPEHKFLTPVFGTACPPKGLSGVVRRYAYRYSEGRLSHWLLLMGADRIDVLESRVAALVRGQPDDLLRESGILTELKHGGLRTRSGQHRADNKNALLDMLRVASTSLAPGAVSQALSRVASRVQKHGPRAAKSDGAEAAPQP